MALKFLLSFLVVFVVSAPIYSEAVKHNDTIDVYIRYVAAVIAVISYLGVIVSTIWWIWS